MKKYIEYCLVTFCFLFILSGISPIFALTSAGTSIESQAEIHHSQGSASSEVIITYISQMYGITIEPVNISAYGTPETTHYFHHTLSNLGNGTDNISVYLDVATPESWVFSIIEDENGNCSFDAGIDIPMSSPVLLGEDAAICLFIAVTISSTEISGTTGWAKLVATGEVFDGGFYIGANGTIYGGPDTAEVTDIITVEAINNLRINREDPTGKIYITWNGGNADIYYIEGTYEASFSGSTTEALNVTSPYYCTIEAKDGKERYYRVALTGTTSYAKETVGKLDIDTIVGFTFASLPFVVTPESLSHLNAVVGTQLTGGSMPVSADKLLSFQGSNWKQSSLITGSGWQGTFQYFTPDIGIWIRILDGHPSGKLTFVGCVSDVPTREINLNQGFTMIGHSYPVEVNLNDTGLDKVLTSGDLPKNADKIYTFEGGTWKQSALISGTGWTGTVTKMVPGKAYWIKKQGVAAVWHYPRPY